jgi:hypothetical protein
MDPRHIQHRQGHQAQEHPSLPAHESLHLSNTVQHGLEFPNIVNGLQDTVGYRIRYAFAEIIGDKVHLRQEILACRPPGGDPPAQKMGLRLGAPSLAEDQSTCLLRKFGVHGAAELIYLVGLYCLVSVTLMGERFTHKRSGMPSGFQSFRREGIAVGDVLLDGLE